MNTALILFGLNLAPLFVAIAQVESDNGKTSANIYQIDEDGHGYTDDVNRILAISCRTLGTTYRPFPAHAHLHRPSAERMMYIYWQFWGTRYQQTTGKPVTYEVLARIHNGGPFGWKKPSTIAYWNRVAASFPKGGK